MIPFAHNIEPVELFTFSVLTPAQADAFKAVRLEALSREVTVFAASCEEEAAEMERPQWTKKYLETPGNCWIGAFVQNKLVGITAVERWAGDPSGRTAVLRSSYIKPEYRGEGAADEFCRQREQWALRNNYETAMLFHRAGHWIGKVVEKFGAKYHHTEPMRFADDKTDNALWYMKPLRRPALRT